MRLKISHITEYRYPTPMEFFLQRLRLTPKSGPGQEVVSWKTSVEGANFEVGYDDHFSNRVQLLSITAETDSVRIIAEGEVVTSDLAGVTGPHVSNAPLWLFKRETPLTKPGKLVRELTRGLTGTDLEKMHALMLSIHEAIVYEPGNTTTATTAEDALEHKKGVCQDHAHAFIAAARSMKIPARYISGYLFMEDKLEQEATHAWAEAYIPDLGWVGFDPANNLCPDERYIRVACGLDYRDTAPVSGMRIGTGEEKMTVTVKIVEAEPGQSQSQSQG
ncbi:transglutaminase family protein [Rhizobium sp. PAMB 3182]